MRPALVVCCPGHGVFKAQAQRAHTQDVLLELIVLCIRIGIAALVLVLCDDVRWCHLEVVFVWGSFLERIGCLGRFASLIEARFGWLLECQNLKAHV